MYKGNPIRLSADFSAETLLYKHKMAWHSVLKEKTSNKKFSILQGFISELKGDRFPDKEKLKEFMTTKLVLQEIWKGTLSEKKRPEWQYECKTQNRD